MKNNVSRSASSRLAVVLALLPALLAALLGGCAAQPAAAQTDECPVIVATLFPQYDFARAVAGDHMKVTLLLPPGVESHAYEPTPADIVSIQNSALFIYTGPQMEAWAENVIDSLPDGSCRVLDVSEGITLLTAGEDGAHEAHGHSLDPHIWTSPENAEKMVRNIEKALSELDPDNAGDYRKNAEAYIAQLEELDGQFREIVENGVRKKIVFGGQFALLYFTEEYGLDWDSAYDSCSGEAEPSASDVARIIEEIRNEGLPAVYYEELTEPRVAQSIADDTGAEPLLFHSCHNVTKQQLADGVTYLDLMRQNAENLKAGLA